MQTFDNIIAITTNPYLGKVVFFCNHFPVKKVAAEIWAKLVPPDSCIEWSADKPILLS